jgi:PAS domain-containing protein
MAAIAPAALSKLIGNIYDCSLDPALWPQTLGEIAQHFNAVTASIFAIEPMAQKIVFSHTWNYDPAQIAADGERTASFNPFFTNGWHSQIDEAARLRSFMDPQEFRRTRFYKEFMVSKSWFDFVNVTLQKSAQRYGAFSAPRPEEQGEASDQELEIMGLLAPHIRRALTIHEALQSNDRQLSNLRAALDLAPSPIILLNDRGEPQEVNRAAEHFLVEAGALRMERGRLYFTDTQVHLNVAAALAAAGKGALCPSETEAIKTAGGRAFAMEMLPLTSPIRQTAAEGGRAVLALFIQEVGALPPLPGEVLVKLYGLTPAEARILVFLAQGMSLSEAADTLSVGEATIKDPHAQCLSLRPGPIVKPRQ